MTDIEASLSVSLDLSSVIETAVRAAVCAVVNEIQRFIGKDVAELRAALSRKECENERLRAQLELARRQPRDSAGSEKNSVLNCDLSSSCNEDAPGNTGSDSDTGSDMRHDFIDPLYTTESKCDLKPSVHYSLDPTETDSGPNPKCEPSDTITDPMTVTTASITSHGEMTTSSVNLVDAHTAGELRIIRVKEEQVKDELPVGLASCTVPGISQPDKEQPYICGVCGKSYLWLSSLKKHQKTHQGMHTNPPLHQCTDCPKTFSFLSSLEKHQLIHTGEKPHQCGLCGKRFRQIQHLKGHYKTHENSKPFRCGVCGWGFNNGSNFKRHLLIHTRQKADEITALHL